MDTYKEQNVKKAVTSNDVIRKFALIIAGISVCGAILMLTGLVAPHFFLLGVMISGFIIYGVFYVLKDMDIEYEYLYTNGDLDIDKIMGQRKRKRLVTVEIHNVTAFGKYTDDVEFDDDRTIVDASTGFEEEHWYMAFTSKKYGDCYLIFTPNSDMLDVIIPDLPRAVRTEVNR